ncbi:MAG TPA: GNAT family N-acetyltransferase [Hyphomicrobium sp.]|jgi:ribosomal protein S18 acetylase RimI-like enzyme
MPATETRPLLSGISIRRFTEIADRERLEPALDAIFFEASATQSFASEDARAVFRERWLGRYLKHEPQWAYVARDADGSVAGYLVGSIDDPRRNQRYGDVGYFLDFAHLTEDYPAHLHVNLAPGYRNRGIGAALIEAFATAAAAAGAAGMHVVTGSGSRNVRFYERNGFCELARATFNANEVVFLGRRLAPPETA